MLGPNPRISGYCGLLRMPIFHVGLRGGAVTEYARILVEIPLSCTGVQLDHLTSQFICNRGVLDRRARLEPLLIASLASLLLCVVP